MSRVPVVGEHNGYLSVSHIGRPTPVTNLSGETYCRKSADLGPPRRLPSRDERAILYKDADSLHPIERPFSVLVLQLPRFCTFVFSSKLRCTQCFHPLVTHPRAGCISVSLAIPLPVLDWHLARAHVWLFRHGSCSWFDKLPRCRDYSVAVNRWLAGDR